MFRCATARTKASDGPGPADIDVTFRRATLLCTALLAIGLTVSACSAFRKEIPQYACPKVLILGDAGSLVRFKPGPGRDITDILFEARIANFVGGCEYTEDGVGITLRVQIAVERGAANRDREIALEYFAAIPAYQPRPEGKSILPVSGSFADNRSRLIYEDEVDLTIPLETGSDGPDVEIVLGFQLTPEEIAYNRSLRRR